MFPSADEYSDGKINQTTLNEKLENLVLRCHANPMHGTFFRMIAGLL